MGGSATDKQFDGRFDGCLDRCFDGCFDRYFDGGFDGHFDGGFPSSWVKIGWHTENQVLGTNQSRRKAIDG